MNYIIRPVRVADSEQINAIRRQPSVMHYTLGLPSERKEKSDQHLANMPDNHHMFVAVEAEDPTKVCGVASLMVAQSPRMRHSAQIGISVHEDYQNVGIGKQLMTTLLDVADNFLMLKRIELGVMVDNPRAIRLYESLGFVHEGTKKAALIRGGHYVDEHIMARIKD